jgi:hypothetical protein
VLISLIAQRWPRSSLFGKTFTGASKIEKASAMTAVEKIQSEIETLSPEEYEHLRL